MLHTNAYCDEHSRIRSMRGLQFLLIAATVAPLLLHGQSKIPDVTVPFVGCESDGQVGPLDVPKGSDVPVPISAAAARRLAYYKAGEDLGVLAPRGWHCFFVYGSSGTTLLVSPDPMDWTIWREYKDVTGPVVAIHHGYGATGSGVTLAVAPLIARVFPAYAAFVAGVKKTFEFENFPSGPYKTDTLSYKNKSVVEYKTPARTEGLGTSGRIRPGDNSISGVAMLSGKMPEPDSLVLSVRLSDKLKVLAPAIIQQLEREAAKLPTPPPPVSPPNR